MFPKNVIGWQVFVNFHKNSANTRRDADICSSIAQ